MIMQDNFVIVKKQSVRMRSMLIYRRVDRVIIRHKFSTVLGPDQFKTKECYKP